LQDSISLADRVETGVDGEVVSSAHRKNNELDFKNVPPQSYGEQLIQIACTDSNAVSTKRVIPPQPDTVLPVLNSTGSGFIVNPSGYVLTNQHVVNGCSSLKIKDSLKKYYAASIMASDGKSDLAILKIQDQAIFATATFRSTDSLVGAGESVVALGFPLAGVLASDVNVSFGYVSATAGLADDTSKLQISAPVQPGNSGGPLLDQAGNVVGVVVQKLDALKVAKAIGDIPQNINFAVKGEIAQIFLKTHRVNFKTVTSSKNIENTGIASKGRSFTVLVECYK
jgi:S1-C subfamily serine protease